MLDPRCFEAHRLLPEGLTVFEKVANAAAVRAPFADVQEYFENRVPAYEARWDTAVVNCAANIIVAELRRRGGCLLELCSVNFEVRDGDITQVGRATVARGLPNLTEIAMLPISYESLYTANPALPDVFTPRTANIVLKIRVFLENLKKAVDATQASTTGVKLRKRVLVKQRLAKLGLNGLADSLVPTQELADVVRAGIEGGCPLPYIDIKSKKSYVPILTGDWKQKPKHLGEKLSEEVQTALAIGDSDMKKLAAQMSEAQKKAWIPATQIECLHIRYVVAIVVAHDNAELDTKANELILNAGAHWNQLCNRFLSTFSTDFLDWYKKKVEERTRGMSPMKAAESFLFFPKQQDIDDFKEVFKSGSKPPAQGGANNDTAADDEGGDDAPPFVKKKRGKRGGKGGRGGNRNDDRRGNSDNRRDDDRRNDNRRGNKDSRSRSKGRRVYNDPKKGGGRGQQKDERRGGRR
jgi:hypothetical protein